MEAQMDTKHYPRIYNTMVDAHIRDYRQMVFISGPRQVGKTTVGESVGTIYLSWDDSDVRRAVQPSEHYNAVFQ